MHDLMVTDMGDGAEPAEAWDLVKVYSTEEREQKVRITKIAFFSHQQSVPFIYSPPSLTLHFSFFIHFTSLFRLPLHVMATVMAILLALDGKITIMKSLGLKFGIAVRVVSKTFTVDILVAQNRNGN